MQDIFASISRIFTDIEADDQAREAVMFAAWRRAAGEQLGNHAVPVRYRDKRLTVAVSGIRWQQQMEHLAPQMVQRLNAAFRASVLKYIDFVIDEPAVKRDTAKRNAAHPAPLDAEVPENLVSASAAIRDDKLREAFLGAVAACLDRPERLSRTK